jgi:type IV pilus assembly protein PilA
MLYKLRNRANEEQGFTLIELLVVILIIGILAAIALPSFLGQRGKAQDSGAKSDSRSLVSHVESCYATEQTYANCKTQAQLDAAGAEPLGMDYGSGSGQVEVTAGDATSFTVVGHSKSGRNFTITKTSGVTAKTCDAPGKGGCPSDGKW